MRDETFVRYGQKPILTPDDIPFTANAVLNPGVAEFDGEVVLLLRIEDKSEEYRRFVSPAAATASMAGGPPSVRCSNLISPIALTKSGAVKTRE